MRAFMLLRVWWRLRCEPHLFHEFLIVPAQIFLIHHSMYPMPHRAHLELELFARRRDGFAVRHRHGLREGPLDHPDHTCPLARSNLYRMDLDARVGREDEHWFQLFDMFLEALGRVTVGIMDQDVRRMALAEPIPFLMGVNVEVQRIEFDEMIVGDPFRLFILRKVWAGDS